MKTVTVRQNLEMGQRCWLDSLSRWDPPVLGGVGGLSPVPRETVAFPSWGYDAVRQGVGAIVLSLPVLKPLPTPCCFIRFCPSESVSFFPDPPIFKPVMRSSNARQSAELSVRRWTYKIYQSGLFLWYSSKETDSKATYLVILREENCQPLSRGVWFQVTGGKAAERRTLLTENLRQSQHPLDTLLLTGDKICFLRCLQGEASEGMLPLDKPAWAGCSLAVWSCHSHLEEKNTMEKSLWKCNSS